MPTEPAPPSFPLSEVPPIAACVTCGLSSCEGCAPELPQSLLQRPTSLPWDEGRLGWTSLVETALITVEVPEVAFGEPKNNGIARALFFAVVCEVLAITSFLVVCAGMGLVVFRRVVIGLLTSPQALAALVSMIGFLSLAMVLIHLLWGEFLERGVGASGHPKIRAQGIRFGLYACGWDLLTSPFGVLAVAIHRRDFLLRPIWAATRIPKRAMRLYLTGARQLSAGEQKTALRHMGLLFLVSGVPSFLAALAAGIVLTLRALG